MKFDHRQDWLDHEAVMDAARERLLDWADHLRDEQKDRAWERALAREAAPWDDVDAFGADKEYRIEAELREEAEKASTMPKDALTSKYGTDNHRHDQNALQGAPDTKETP